VGKDKVKLEELQKILADFLKDTEAVMPTKNENFKGGENFRW
jgi:hypothetical protein